MDFGNSGVTKNESELEDAAAAAAAFSPRKSTDNSIWVALDFPRVCVETVIATGSLDCESMDPVFRSDMFSCLLENARKRLEEAITGSCKKPCIIETSRDEELVNKVGKSSQTTAEWDAAAMAGLGFKSFGGEKERSFEQSVSYFSVSSIWSNDCGADSLGSSSSSGDCPGNPPEGLFYVLPFLLLKELLAVEQVCKSLKDAVAGDAYLWRHLKVDHSLSTKLTDASLLKLAARAQGRLQSLMLIECLRISDETVEQVVASNPMISRIYLPGCIRVSVDAVVRMVELLQQGQRVGLAGVKQIKIRGLTGISKDNLERLQVLLGVDERNQKNSKPHYYLCGDVSTTVDDKIIDVEACPRCKQPRAVYDCTRSKCQVGKSAKVPDCRGCIFCIPRCEDCGKCIDDTDYEETFCLRLLCSECWIRLPKCLECNRPGCESTAEYFIRKPEAMFVCPDCQGDYRGSSAAGGGLKFYVI